MMDSSEIIINHLRNIDSLDNEIVEKYFFDLNLTDKK